MLWSYTWCLKWFNILNYTQISVIFHLFIHALIFTMNKRVVTYFPWESSMRANLIFCNFMLYWLGKDKLEIYCSSIRFRIQIISHTFLYFYLTFQFFDHSTVTYYHPTVALNSPFDIYSAQTDCLEQRRSLYHCHLRAGCCHASLPALFLNADKQRWGPCLSF